jgi:hypothetical protein
MPTVTAPNATTPTTPATDPSAAPRLSAQYAGAARPTEPPAPTGWTSGSAGPQFAPNQPYRAETPSPTATQPITPIGVGAPANRPANPPKFVGSRTFALEYDLDTASAAVARVELWGTRDGGATWSRFTQDNDNRSPLVVTVDNEGLYGFRIIAATAASAAPLAPRSGDAPELWVQVDLKRPIVELTSIERGENSLADHLVIRWRAEDNNLQPRPISIFFSSRPGGPWSAVATNVDNSGQYAWRVERYVPSRIYLRIEARDTAGNLAAFQTREPVEFTAGAATARLRTQP